ncbi:hypothetical protein HOY80DRAFT_958559 [Tuber brumale]|nr:hypothetical protein HOY80DRAFT_958559 [Tuber brumale]
MFLMWGVMALGYFAWENVIEAEAEVSKLLDDTLFFPRLPDINSENLHHASGAPAEKNKAQRGELYNLIIATNRLLPIATSFFRQIVEQLWPHLNPNGGVLLMIERGTPIGFKAIAYTRSTILKGDYIKDIGEAFQSRQATNARGSANPHIEKRPGATIAPRTNHEECLIFVTGPTDGTQRKD